MSLKLAEELIAYAIKGKIDDGVTDRYTKSKEYQAGIHKISNRKPKLGNKVVNKFAEIHENEVAVISEALPKWFFKPQSDDDIIAADQINQIVGDVIWDKNEWYDKGEVSVDEAAHAGSSVVKTRAGKDGYPYFDVLTNDEWLPDPLVVDHEKMRFAVHVVPQTVKSIKKQFKKDVQAEDIINNRAIGFDQVLKSFEQSSSTNMKFDMRAYQGGMPINKRFDSVSKSIGMALTFRVYLDDDKMEKKKYDVQETEEEHTAMLQGKSVVPYADDNHVEHINAHKEKVRILVDEESAIAKPLIEHIAQHEQYIKDFPDFAEKKLAFPYGRRIIISQGAVLDDGPVKIPIRWQDQFLKWDWIRQKGRYWGKGLGHDLFDPQDLLNHRENAITQNINSINYGLIKVRSGAFGDKTNVTMSNLIGQVVTLNDPQRDLIRDPGQPLPSSHWQDLGWLEGHMERKAGQGGLKAGRLPAGSPAGVTVETLLQQGMKPSSAVVRRYSSVLKKMGRNAMVIMSELLDDNEKFLITGKDPKEVRWGDIKNLGFKDIRVDVVGQMTTSRDRQLQTALLMKQNGIYDNMAVLDAIDDPKKFDVIKRQNETNQLQSFVVQQEQTIGQYKDVVEKMSKEINTLQNRQQSSDGSGNVSGTGKSKK